MTTNGLKGLYIAFLAGGTLFAAMIYTVLFDSLSETELVQITVLWFLPIVIGVYGLASLKLVRMRDEGRAGSVHEAARLAIGTTGVLGYFALLPFLLLRWRSSLLVTVAAAGVWAVALFVFFTVVFPQL